MAVSQDLYRLYKGGQLLGGEDVGSQLIQSYEGEAATYSGVGGTFATTQGHLDALNRFNAEIAANQGRDATLAVLNKWGIPASQVDQSQQLIASRAVTSLPGYTPTSLGVADQYYSSKFGNVGGFSEGELMDVYDRVYGKIQAAPDLGQGWKDLYHQYDTWRQQDRMWYEATVGKENELFHKAVGQQKAAMAAGGMAVGSTLWNQNLAKLNNERLNVEQTYRDKQAALQDTSVYQSLMKQFNELRNAPEMRGKQVTETRFRDVLKYHEGQMIYKPPQYGRDSETGEEILIRPAEEYWQPEYYETVQEPYQHTYTKGVETGRKLYGSDPAKLQTPTFDEFFDKQFGRPTSVDNPYAEQGLTNQSESPEDRRARLAASGAAFE